MKNSKVFKMIMTAGLIATTSLSYAAAPVKVTVKHVGSSSSDPAELNQIGSNVKRTLSLSSPSPKVELNPGSRDDFVFTDWSTVSSTLALKYDFGSKSCSFMASYVKGYGTPPFSKPATVNHKATPSGGARCTSKITSLNLSTGQMSVEFTMR